MKNSQLETIFVAVLAAICLTISTFQTARGYLDAAGSLWLSVPLSIVITGAMGLVSLRLWKSAPNNFERPTLIAIFAFVSFFSVAANLNAFYSSEIAEEAARNDAETVRHLFNSLEAQIDSAVAELTSNSEALVSKVEQEKIILIAQVLDPNQPGVGVRARVVIDRINEILATELTLPNPGAPERQARMLEDQIDKLVQKEREAIDNKYAELKSMPKNEFSMLDISLDSPERPPEPPEVMAQVAEAYAAYNKVGASAQELLSQAGYNFEPKYYRGGEFGSIPFALDSALSGRHPTAAIIALLLSLLIDYTVPFLILVVQHGAGSSAASFPGPRSDKREPFI